MFETDRQNELEREISKGRSLVLFYAGWCPDCFAFMPKFNSLPALPKTRLAKARIDEDGNSMWGSFAIEVVPTVVLFENGKEKARSEETSHGACAKGMAKLLEKGK